MFGKKRKKRNFLLATILISLFFISACQGLFPEGSSEIPDGADILKGREGIVISFFENAPPDKVSPGSQIKVALLIENKGSASVNCDGPRGCGYFKVIASDLEIAEEGKLRDALDQIDGQFQIIGKESYISGGRAVMELNAIVPPTIDRTKTSTVTVNACYPYVTKLTATVCINTAPYSVPEDDRACKLRDISLRDQGAPLAVKKITQDSIPSANSVRPRYRIFLDDIGKGSVLGHTDASLAKACTSLLEVPSPEGPIKVSEARDIITISNAQVAGIPMDCLPAEFSLSGNSKQDFIECTLQESKGFTTVGATDNFVSTLSIEFSYGYKTTSTKSFKIEVLDTPPDIMFDETKFIKDTKKINPTDKLELVMIANDDFGVESIELFDGNDRLIEKHDCNGALRCVFKKEVTPPGGAGDEFTYSAKSTDTNDKPSRLTTKVTATLKEKEKEETDQQETEDMTNPQPSTECTVSPDSCNNDSFCLDTGSTKACGDCSEGSFNCNKEESGCESTQPCS